jgi:hypothetical protein
MIPLRLLHISIAVALLLLLGAPPATTADDHIQGRGQAVFARVAVAGTPAAGAAQPMYSLLPLKNLGIVLIYCYIDATPTTNPGFAFQNTTSRAVVVAPHGTVKPGERVVVGGTFQVASSFSDVDRIATVTVSEFVDGQTCMGHAHALVQP